MLRTNSFFRSLLLCGLALVLFCIHGGAKAQNIQFHYDLGRHVYPEVQRGRPYITTTIEQQSVDRYGDTFYFVDMTFLDQGAVGANWKFMRNLRFWSAPWSWHVRYDGGLRFVRPEETPVAISINDAFMMGVTYTYLSPNRQTMLSLSPLYKYIKGIDRPHNYELCAVWKHSWADNLFSATGFISFWHQEDNRPGWGTRFKLMSQPQFWCNLNHIRGVSRDFKLSVGTEIRISNNIDAAQWLVIPTLALRWSFGRL